MFVPAPEKGSLSLFRFRGITVFLHWSWLLVALWQIQNRRGNYDQLAWVVAEYVALFGIVLLHEFGHAFAARQVGGTAENILLWPFGGIAYLNTPPRPGARLWSIAAGPLVNVALIPVFYLFQRYTIEAEGVSDDLYHFARMLHLINIFLLIFNLLPIYPTDGGQILQALLWYWLGFAKALLIASGIGLVGGLALMGYAFYLTESLLTLLLAFFLLGNCWKAFQAARSILAQQKALSGQMPPAPPGSSSQD